MIPLRLLGGPRGEYLLAGSSSSRWAGALGRTGVVDLRRDLGVRRCRVYRVTDATERAEVLGAATRRYGTPQVDAWFPDPGAMFRVGGVGAAASQTYAAWVADEFDRVSPSYREQVARNPVERYLRDRSLELLRRRLRDAPRLIEVGGGVGLETLPMLEEGHEVTVVDVSTGMLAALRERAREAGLAERLTTRVGSLGALDAVPDLGEFDGGWSTFGAVNCEPDLRLAAQGLARCLRPGSALVLAVLNRWAVVEILGYALTFRFARAGARLAPTLRVGDSRFSVDCHPYAPAEVERALTPWFRRESALGLLVAIPPPDWLAGRRPSPTAIAALARVDARLGAAWPFNGWGDHSLLTFVRTLPSVQGGAG